MTSSAYDILGKARKAAKAGPLPYLKRDMPLHDREWLIFERIPNRNVTLLSGEGGVGKSVLLMQLAVATVLGKDWLGMRPAVGPVIYLGAEDDDDELRRRFDLIARHYGSTWEAVYDAGLRVLSFAGRDAVLGKPDRDGIIRATDLLREINEDVITQWPKLFIVDPAADVFAGKEIDRAQVRQFITLLRAIAINGHCAVVLAAHPSVAGIRDKTGLSGSTQWHNSVRARLYLTRPERKNKSGKHNDDSNDDARETGLRILDIKKNNYAKDVVGSLPLRYQNGVYVVERKDAFDQVVDEVHAEEVFLRILREYATQDRFVSDRPSSAYAPTAFVNVPSVGNLTKRELELAMNRLFSAKRIKVDVTGPPSRRTRKIVIVEATASDTASEPPSDPVSGPSSETSDARSDAPSDGVQTPSDDVCTHTPLYPHPRLKGDGGSEARPPTGVEKARRARGSVKADRADSGMSDQAAGRCNSRKRGLRAKETMSAGGC